MFCQHFSVILKAIFSKVQCCKSSEYVILNANPLGNFLLCNRVRASYHPGKNTRVETHRIDNSWFVRRPALCQQLSNLDLIYQKHTISYSLLLVWHFWIFFSPLTIHLFQVSVIRFPEKLDNSESFTSKMWYFCSLSAIGNILNEIMVWESLWVAWQKVLIISSRWVCLFQIRHVCKKNLASSYKRGWKMQCNEWHR